MSPTDDVPRLTVRGGLLDGLSVALDTPGDERLLGSDAECDMELTSAVVSPVHARFLAEEGAVLVVDASSLNGTFVNGNPVQDRQALRDGDRITLGPPSSPDAIMLVAHIPGARGTRTGRAPSAADFTTEPPSMVPEGMADGGATGPLGGPAPLIPRATEPAADPKRMAMVGAGALGLAAVVFYVLRWLMAGAPVIHAALPPRVEPGQTLTLHATQLGEGGEVRVLLGEAELTPTRVEAGQVAIVVPAELAAQAPLDLPVRIVAGGRRSSSVFVRLFLAPRVASLEPDVAVPGDTVLIRGEHFDDEGLDVTLAGVGGEILESTATRLRFRVPEITWRPGQSQPVAVRARDSRAAQVSLIMGRLPLVTSVSPDRGEPGQVVTIGGRGFEGELRVRFGGSEAVSLTASATELQVLAPGAGAGPLPVEVLVNGSPAMTSATFTLTRASANVFRPRFFPQAVPGAAPEQRLDVANELGPVLRLTGPADAPSTASRAARVSAALSDLMQGKTAPALEVRQTPGGPAVSVPGRQFPIVTVTAADVTGYGGQTPPSADELAGFWAALLGDQMALFLHGARPSATAELSGHAAALAGLQADAFRRGQSAGVPRALVSPPDARLIAGLQRLALDFPSASPPVPGVVVAGRWTGQYKEQDQPDRGVQIDIVLLGNKLEGTLVTRSGRVEGRLPLSDVRYSNGRLRFLLDAGGSPRYFDGTLAGVRIEGSISDTASGGRRLGQFSLNFGG